MVQLRRRPDVAFVEPDCVAQQMATPDDPLYDQQWGLAKIMAPAAWDVQTGGSVAAVQQGSASFDGGGTYGSAQNGTPLQITVAGNAPYG